MKKEKRRLVLNGTDDAYAKREATLGASLASKPSADSPNSPGAAFSGQRLVSASSGQSTEPPEAAKATGSEIPETEAPIQVNFRLNLGDSLSEQLQRLADAHDQPIDFVMKGLRNKAAERFKWAASENTKPSIPEPASGGLSVRYAATFSGYLARNLNQWFDPFGLGVAKEACKPILVEMFQQEAKALCVSADREAPNHPQDSGRTNRGQQAQQHLPLVILPAKKDR